MLQCLKYTLVILLIQQIQQSESGFRKRNLTSQYDIFQSDTLPSDTQITIFLTAGIMKTFYFWSTVNNGSVSITVTTCSSAIQWSVKLYQNNSIDVYPVQPLWTVDEIQTTNFTSVAGLYQLDFVSSRNDTYLHIYVSTEIGGPRVLLETKSSKIYIHKRRKKIIVKWHPSLVDPQNTEYCLAIHNQKLYKTLCKAQLEKTEIMSHTFNFQQSKYGANNYPIIACVGQKLQFPFNNPNMYETYYFSLFASNRQNNFTYLYGTSSTKVHLKPIALKDGKLMSVNLNKMDGDIVFRFKIPRNTDNLLKLFIASCDSKIIVKISKKQKILLTKNITKYGIMRLEPVDVGTRYSIRITLNGQDIENKSFVQILVSSRSDFKVPFPLLPPDTKIREYESLKTCNSITIGWYAQPQIKFGHYCFLVKEGQINNIKEDRDLNQCGIQKITRTSKDFVVHYCRDIDHRKSKVVIEKVRYLLPGKKYVFQVVVKKPKGKSLSYDLFQTHTLRSCSHFD